MANYFDQELWRRIGERLKEFIPRTTREINEFAYKHELPGVRLDRIANGAKGTSVETLVKICTAADANPTYLLFGKGKRHLSEVSNPSKGQVKAIMLEAIRELPEKRRLEATREVTRKIDNAYDRHPSDMETTTTTEAPGRIAEENQPHRVRQPDNRREDRRPPVKRTRRK